MAKGKSRKHGRNRVKCANYAARNGETGKRRKHTRTSKHHHAAILADHRERNDRVHRLNRLNGYRGGSIVTRNGMRIVANGTDDRDVTLHRAKRAGFTK